MKLELKCPLCWIFCSFAVFDELILHSLWMAIPCLGVGFFWGEGSYIWRR